MILPLIFFLSVICGTASDIGVVGPVETVPGRVIDRDISCDSLYTGNFVDHTSEMRDTVINGAKYAWAYQLSDKYTLAFSEYNEEYKSLQYINFLSEGVPYGHYAGRVIEDAWAIHYGDILPSPSNKYIFYCKYYTTWDIRLFDKGIEEEILKFSCGEIMNVETGDIACNLFGSDVAGDWNYCDQWVVDDEVLFDPRETE